jgi:hypothetical protein
MNTIYNEIAEEFGSSALSINHTAPVMPIRIAQRIANKYPSDFSQGRFNSTLNPKAVVIAKRYMSLVMGVK